MPRLPAGTRALTGAEREARRRQRKAEREAEAWRRVLAAETIQEARAIAAAVLATKPFLAKEFQCHGNENDAGD